MKTTIKANKKVNLKILSVKAGVRYWEDSTIDGIEDHEGILIPCRNGEYWCPEIDIDAGQILNWKRGVTDDIHYQVCDDGEYHVKDAKGKTVLSKEGYVPETMSPAEEGFGDYIIMKVDENGIIADWKFNAADFIEDEDE